MESTNDFKKGMVLDVNPLNQPASTYREAYNLRLVNDVGGTSYSINNILGNSFDLTIPATTKFQKIGIVAEAGGQTLMINGQTGTAFNTTGWTPQDLYDYITTDAAYTLLNVQYKVYVGNSFLVVVPIAPFTLTMSQPAGVTLTIDANYVPVQTALEIIGYTTIREDIYLFTTSNTTKNPGGHSFDTTLPIDASSVGQIWKYTYNKITLVGSLTLIYNGYTDFSTYYAIAPTAAQGRYENADTQRIYWTDNFNKLRSINAADPNAIALDVSLLDVRPAVDFDIPILTGIRNSGGASVRVGAYQCAYRLKNTGGAITNYSELSNIAYVVPADEAGNIGGAGFKDYVGAGAGTNTNKSITWSISNLDIDYERIEIAILRRDNKNSPADVFLIIDEPLSGDSFSFTYDGTEDEIPVTLEEFNTLTGVFTHCKTIGSKDNRLFVGNVRNQFSEIDFDARAFRAKTSGADDIYLTNNAVQTLYNSTTAQAIVETEDTINDYTNANAGFYRPNTAVLGGEGLNVAYEFVTIAIAADVTATGQVNFNVGTYVGAPWRHTNPRFFGSSSLDLNVISPDNNNGTAVQTYPAPVSGINDGFKYPHISGFYRGYNRNEIYRFGIQFFDKDKQPYFVKWIGDIKFPDFNSVNANSFYEDGSATGIADYRLSFVANKVGYDECFVQALGINFEITNLETISNQISGYSIVRVKREVDDRTIVAQGYITPVDEQGGQFYTTSPYVNADGNGVWGGSYPQRGFFITPEICQLEVSPDTTMNFKIKASLTTANSNVSNTTGGTDPYYMYKLYNFTPTGTTIPGAIQQISYMGYAGTTIDDASGTDVFNYDYGLGGEPVTVSQSIGNAAFFFRLGGNVGYPGLNAGKLFVVLDRTVSDQYGGNTYSSRSKNEYISCSHFRPVRTTVVPISDDFKVFGGDIYVNMYDSCRWAKNFGNSGRGISDTAKMSTVFYVPMESGINTDLRYGTYMNRSFTGGNGYETELIETYEYNPVYSAECSIKTYNPKPDPFSLNEEFDNRFYASEIKINGEFSDSWGTYLPNNYWDVEGIYGPINAMLTLRDKMYFWQSRAFGIIEINPRSIVTDVNSSANSQLQIGTGLPLQRHDYLSTEIGLQHQWGLTKSSYKLFWLDAKNRKFFTFSEGESIHPESDVKGLLSFFNDKLKYNILTVDKPTYMDSNIGVNGIRAVYDFKYNQAIFTVHDGRNVGSGQSSTIPFTVAYDEAGKVFSTFYNYVPRVYFSDGYKVFSTNPTGLSSIYIHDKGNYCQFYGTTYSSSIKIVINPNFQFTKVFDNIMFDSESLALNAFGTYTNKNDNTWTRIRVYNDYQNTDYQTLTLNSNIKRKERTWQLAVPRNRVLYTGTNSPNIFDPTQLAAKDYGERMRDKYIIIDLENNNSVNELLAFNNLRTKFRQSPR